MSDLCDKLDADMLQVEWVQSYCINLLLGGDGGGGGDGGRY